jgi:hypothetical protein
LTCTLDGKILVWSIFKMVGYPLHTQVASSPCLTHNVINHVSEFVEANGTHTNNIEGFWSD